MTNSKFRKFLPLLISLFVLLGIFLPIISDNLAKNSSAFLQKIVNPASISLSAAEVDTAVDTAGDGDSSIDIRIDAGEAGTGTSALDILFLLAFLALLPSFLLMMTSFLRIIISLSFLKSAMGIQVPPTQVLVGIALFLSFFIMTPTIKQINDVAYQPYQAGEMSATEAIQEAGEPLKEFMLRQTYDADLKLFLSLSDEYDIENMEKYDTQEELLDLSLFVIVPSFITSELRRGFMIGFLLYIPFLVVDIVVSSTLMAMGMVMLPPAMISLPFKLMLFVVVDGWGLLFESLITSFH
jgi:flagellar biosynthetic protein FliP